MDVTTGMREAADRLAAKAADLTDAEFVAECREFTRDWNTLPWPLAGMRRAALRRLRLAASKNGQMAWWVARQLGIDPNRFSKLTRPESASA